MWKTPGAWRIAWPCPRTWPGGTYTLCLSFLDPDSGLPALPLNMAGGENLRYPLYAITIK